MLLIAHNQNILLNSSFDLKRLLVATASSAWSEAVATTLKSVANNGQVSNNNN